MHTASIKCPIYRPLTFFFLPLYASVKPSTHGPNARRHQPVQYKLTDICPVSMIVSTAVPPEQSGKKKKKIGLSLCDPWTRRGLEVGSSGAEI